VERAAAGVTWEAIEAELLGGQKLQGTVSARPTWRACASARSCANRR